MPLVFGLSFDIQQVFEGILTYEHRAFIKILQVIEEFLPAYESKTDQLGRKGYEEISMIRSALAKQFFKIPTVTSLRNRLLCDLALRQICGLAAVPSEATFSKFASLAHRKIMEETLGPMVSFYLKGHIVEHISRDSTAIGSRAGQEQEERSDSEGETRQAQERIRTERKETNRFAEAT